MNRQTPLLLLALVASLAQAADWPQWRGPDRDGAWNETEIVETFPSDGLKISWRVPVGRGWSSPVVVGDRVYLTDAQVKRPTAIERVLCLDAANGEQLWSHEYTADYPDWAFEPNAGGPRATPIVHDGRIYTLGAIGDLRCLDAMTGVVVWQRNLSSDYTVKPFTGITGSPLIDGNLLILAICAKGVASVVALKTATGQEVWRALDDTFSYSSPIVITAGGKKQLIVWLQEAVTSLDPATGITWWRELIRTTGDTAVSTPVFANGRLLVGGLMFQLASEKPAATVLWPHSRVAMKRILSITSTALLRGDHVYSARYTGELVCLEAATGEQVWEDKTITTLQNGSSIHITPCGNTDFLFTDRGDLISAHLSPGGYREISRARLLEPTSPFGDRKCVWTAPAYAHRHVFARNDTEIVCASLAK